MAVLFTDADSFEPSGELYRLLADDTLIIGPDALLVTTGAEADGVVLAGGNTLRIMGELVAADGRGVQAGSGGNSISVTAGGSAFGATRGINLLGEFNLVDVAGAVGGGDYAVVMAVLDTDAASRNLLTVAAGGRLSATGAVVGGVPGTGIAVRLDGAGSRLTNAGEIDARGTAVVLSNPSLYDVTGGLSVVNAGRIASADGDALDLSGTGRASVVNDGRIVGTGAGVTLAADTVELRNAGTISALLGPAVFAAGWFQPFTATIVNDGLIESLGGPTQRAAVETSAGAIGVTLVNGGDIRGGVRFRDGDNLYDGRDGAATLGEVQGGLGRDTLLGGAGGETLAGGDGDDMLRGHAGDDVLRGGLGGDLLDGGAGLDTVDYARSPAAVRIDLNRGLAIGAGSDVFGFAGDDQASGDTLLGIERLRGSDQGDWLGGGGFDDTLWGGLGGDLLLGRGGHDLLLGEAGADTLRGGGGRDTLLGGDGADQLEGGGRADRLEGGLGNDTLLGGTAADVFVFGVIEDTEDLILDFSRAEGDRIDLTGLARSSAGFAFLGARGFSGLGGEVRAEYGLDRTTVLVDVDAGGAPELVFVLAGAIALEQTDFLV